MPLHYWAEEVERVKRTNLWAKDTVSGKEVLVAFWQWRLTGRQSAWQAAEKLRESRQRMADKGAPLKVEAEFLSGPVGSNKKKPVDLKLVKPEEVSK